MAMCWCGVLIRAVVEDLGTCSRVAKWQVHYYLSFQRYIAGWRSIADSKEYSRAYDDFRAALVHAQSVQPQHKTSAFVLRPLGADMSALPNSLSMYTS